MNSEQEILLAFYKSETDLWRHQELQRATITNVFVVVSAALIGLITYDKIFHEPIFRRRLS